MKFTKFAAVLLAILMASLPTQSFGATKGSAKKSSPKKTVVKKATKKTAVTQKKSPVTANETKTLYGVKGAKLQPTKVSTKRYSYREKGKTHTTISKEASRLYSQTGVASYYGGMFDGRKTASGEIFNKNAYTAAHKTLALGSYALVTNLRNGRKVIVKINDRGPFSKARIIDLSVAAAREIGMLHSGVAKVRVEAMQVDSQGYIIGKGAESLRKLAQKEGLAFRVKGSGNNLAIKAEISAKKPEKQTASKAAKQPSPSLTVITDNEKEAKKIARAVKQKAYVEKVGKQYRVVIAVTNLSESKSVKKQIVKLAHYQSIHYSAK
ncbi:septal ring lytic transglycosylase RlpA family protein [Muribacter muris]|uniref:Endolytic peptidoglycan transglycosylase RlpA n=1 Tax=Muribacter muris TaxID=67855 RepID=A0A4Y9JTG3_9PAST|nr:septal ring lytic transglycosylase RlpA family protein [Muribacter muris]MBF0785592.1 septal ring lytic transglycosylase RlpA family protein [Muribacter muris]MBF0828008.1 septal ring lytic transglycosylase RlpA family protein [Muribacter muris]TFV09084.1 septal ring lytic transglycosylase RlpA family protein [Muribacter muris]